MKFIIATLVIVSFLALAGFGLFAMGHDAGHGTGSCIIANPQGVVCGGENAFAIIRAHIEAFTGVLVAVSDSFGAQAALFIVIIISALSGIRFFIREENLFSGGIAFSFFRQSHIPLVVPSEEEILRWLAFCTNSPSIR